MAQVSKASLHCPRACAQHLTRCRVNGITQSLLVGTWQLLEPVVVDGTPWWQARRTITTAIIKGEP